ncbi:MAG: hypothetical protein JXB32_25970 [Deltaproteobacteria bacterium]|nr:hypothetical protein [Deltaproteobacteria bacterium]
MPISGSPALAWTGSQYGLAWVDRRDSNEEVRFMRFDSEGASRGPSAVISTEVDYFHPSALVWDGTVFGLGWEGWGRVFLARLGADGTVLSTTTTPTTATDDNPVVVAGNGRGFVLAWRTGAGTTSSVARAFFNSAGAQVGVNEVIADAAARVTGDPVISSQADSFGVAWTDMRDGNMEVYFARLDSAGTKSGTDVRVSSAPELDYYPAIAGCPGGFAVVWSSSARGLIFRQLDLTGRLVGEEVVVDVRPVLSEVGIAWSSAGYALASRWGGGSLWTAAVRSDGSVTRSLNEVLGGHDFLVQPGPSIVAAGDIHAAAWSSFEGASDIYFARICAVF